MDLGNETKTVVCGGTGYKTGDVVAYIPVGGKYKGNLVIEKDMKGGTSCGVIMGRVELGLPSECRARALWLCSAPTPNLV